MAIKKVLVTGSDGHIGRVVVKELQDHGYEVTPADLRSTQPWLTQIVDTENFGQVVAVMHGHDAVIHLAAIPSPVRHPAEVVFRNNVMSQFNILEAATVLGIKHVVTASSLSALGHPYMHRHFNPVYVPIDEPHPLLSQDNYGLSKMIGEEICEAYLRRTPDMSLASMRFTWVKGDEGTPFAQRQREHGAEFSGSFWTYVDVRDAAAACRLAMEYDKPGHEAYYICAPNSFTVEPIEELMRQHYPGDYPFAEHIRGDKSIVDCSKAERLLGWKPRYNWDGTEF